jgi:hypothetical protein
LRLNADVQNLDSVEGARIPVGGRSEELAGWQFNAGAGDGGAVSKLGFRFSGVAVVVSSGNISGHRSFQWVEDQWWIGSEEVRRGGRRVGQERWVIGEGGEAVRRELDEAVAGDEEREEEDDAPITRSG